jgi:serine/threonine-protein kinase
MMDDRYVIESLLGAGGVGQVYRAHDRRLDRQVALKLIRSDSPDQEVRLLEEARAQARVTHDHVAEVFEVGRHSGRPCVVMRLVDGPTLEAVADELDVADAARIVSRVGRAVYAAHQLGLIHRDLKPGNVLLEQRGDDWQPFVVDFGLATQLEAPGLTATGVVSGTPHYMAPEQIRGERSRSIDVWALGAILYRLVSGRPPHTGDSSLDVLVKTTSEDALPIRRVAPGTPADLAAVIDRAVASEPEDRYASAALLADDLDRFVRGEPVSARRLGPARRTLRWMRRHRAASAAAAAALVILTATTGLAIRERLRASQQAALGQELGGEARDIAWWMRAAELAPRHDIRPERREVRHRMEVVEGRLRELGSVAIGPTAYALGRAHLALAEPAAARVQLERAVAAGYETTVVFEALGTVLSELYRDELAKASRITDAALRKVRLELLEADLATPARSYLDRAAASSDDLLVRARRAFLDGDFDEAANLAQQARVHRIWLTEAFLLEAAAIRADADRLRTEGEYPAAEATYARADTVLAAAADVADSSFSAHLDRCALWTAVMDLRLYRSGEDPGSAFEAADSSCRAASEIAPDVADVWSQWSAALRLRGLSALRRGDPFEDSLNRAIELGRRAIELAPDAPEAHRRLGLALRVLARSQARNGVDPRATMREALAALEKSASLGADAVSWSDVGLARSSLARQEAFHGGSPDAEFDLAIQAQETAIELAPYTAPLWVNLSEVLKNRGVYELDHGRDARESLGRAVTAAERAVELNAEYVTAWRNLGLARWYLGDAQWQQGEDPQPALAAALTAFEKLQQLDPESALAWTDTANVCLLQAQVLATSGRSPDSALRAAARSLDHAASLDPELVWLHFLRGAVALEQARWAVHTGADSESELERARLAFRSGLDTQPDNPFALTDQARVALVDAQHRLDVGSDPSPLLERAEASIEKALEVDAELAPAHAAAGLAHLLRAEWADATEGDPTTAIARSEAALARAATIDGRLARIPFHRARLELLRARRARGDEDHRAAVTAARAHIARARELRPSWIEAIALAGAIETEAAFDDAAAAATAAELFRRAFEADPDLRRRYGEEGVTRRRARDRSPIPA